MYVKSRHALCTLDLKYVTHSRCLKCVIARGYDVIHFGNEMLRRLSHFKDCVFYSHFSDCNFRLQLAFVYQCMFTAQTRVVYAS
jgi:hypothetical protein